MFQVAKAIVTGLSHRNASPPIPCQDFAKAGVLPNGFDVIIVSDGAGSSRHSDRAARLCVDTLFWLLESCDLSIYSKVPSGPEELESQWRQDVFGLFDKTRNKLKEFAVSESMHLRDLNCTLLLVLRTNWGFLSANIGDGRSGYYDGSPSSLTVPFMTFTAGATCFLLSEGWDRPFRSYVTKPENFDRVEYFFASTDGPQAYLIDGSGENSRCGVYDDVLGSEAFYDSNKPYHPFFQGLMRSLHEVMTESERDQRVARLLQDGIYILEGKERVLHSLISPDLDDDKTLVLYFR
jgi:hypothetical protein